MTKQTTVRHTGRRKNHYPEGLYYLQQVFNKKFKNKEDTKEKGAGRETGFESVQMSDLGDKDLKQMENLEFKFYLKDSKSD